MSTRKISPTGVMLILLGILALSAQFTALGVWILPALALVFLVWGLWTRTAGLLIPGGILAGLSLGIALAESPALQANEQTQGGAFMLAFAAGWALITLLSAALGETMRWPLIPAGIMGFIGLGLLLGGPALMALEWSNKLWPLLLVALGIRLLWRSKTQNTEN